MAVARQLRYSPRNFLIVDWSSHGRAFADCGLPKPIPCLTGGESCGDACAHPLSITEAIDTYDWERWLPEVIIGIEDPDEEIAANYVRQAAIEFCKGARVLQREVVIQLEPGATRYPVFPYAGEQIIGVIGIRNDDDSACSCLGGNITNGLWHGSHWQLDTARNEFIYDSRKSTGLLRLLVWAAPTEAACVQDVFLYDRFRQDITLGARQQYAMAMHFRDRALMSSLAPADMFQRAILLAKTKALMQASSWPLAFGNMFGSGLRRTREDAYFHRS
jgi:hypothetical protein